MGIYNLIISIKECGTRTPLGVVMGVVGVLGVVAVAVGVLSEEQSPEANSPLSSCYEHQSSTAISDNTLLELVDEISLKAKKRRYNPSLKPTNKWSRAEIEMLLKLINIHGTDFSLIALRMRKTRDQIKRKYTILERTHTQVLQDIFGRQVKRDQELQTFYENMVTEK